MALLFSLWLALSPISSGTAPVAGSCVAEGTCCCLMDNGLHCCGPSGNCQGGAIAGCPCRNPASS